MSDFSTMSLSHKDFGCVNAGLPNSAPITNKQLSRSPLDIIKTIYIVALYDLSLSLYLYIYIVLRRVICDFLTCSTNREVRGSSARGGG
jgi:hypothetical protein